ncbi:MIP/aquaporin family protein [Arthrobacter sp. ISL-5]|uniref:MIP/aquaporin family protein n=1 Tax=Arthrobacter sp. ISL-5 TaxID=2819111 RepID=UPI001BE98489|nr:aquaporin [Arthrobacter sp. ISL-5]MBT2553817.1 aquaporin [Arthrobacter sp. ISL-5]
MTTPVSVPPTDAESHASGDDGFRPGLVSRLGAEAFGTLFLVIAGLGVPLFTLPQSSPLPASLAGGLAVTAAMLAFAYISGGHFNPAITLGNLVAGKIRIAHAAAYIGAQLVGAAAGALTLFGILRTVPNIPDTRAAFDTVTAGFGEHSVIQAPMAGVLLAEVLGAALLVAVFLGTTARRNVHAAAAPFAVGLAFAVLLQFGQAIGNAPFNPARATASALFSNSWSLGQLWLFWVAPLVGAAIAGLVFRGFSESAAVGAAAARSAGEDEEAAADSLDSDDENDESDDGKSDDGADARRASADRTSAAGGAAPAAAGGAAAGAAPGSAKPAAAGDRTAGTRDEARDFFDGPSSK